MITGNPTTGSLIFELQTLRKLQRKRSIIETKIITGSHCDEATRLKNEEQINNTFAAITKIYKDIEQFENENKNENE